MTVVCTNTEKYRVAVLVLLLVDGTLLIECIDT